MATNIPPHNLTEVINGCLAYVDNEDITIEGLMEHVQARISQLHHHQWPPPGYEEAYRGRGKVYIRARAEVEADAKTGRETSHRARNSVSGEQSAPNRKIADW
ncbi:hypothetical protein ACNKHQ_13305 [Shigella flexneri]